VSFPQGTQAKGFYRRMKHPRAQEGTSPSQHNANSAVMTVMTVTRFETRRKYCETLSGEMRAQIKTAFQVSSDPNRWSLAGHSNGGDMALIMLTTHPLIFGGAIAISPGGASRALKLPAKTRSRVALAYAADDLRPVFATATATVAAKLAQTDIPHLVHFLPDTTHDPASVQRFLSAGFSFVVR
jgi:S-formylglutathione hydrolase FrmB